MLNQAALFVLAGASLWASQTLAPGAPTSTFHSESFNFDLIYPASFTNSQVPAAGFADSSCVTMPIQLTEMATGFNMISVKQYDEACLKKQGAPSTTLGSAATTFLTDSLSLLGKPVINPNANYYLAGHNASAVSGMVKVSPSGGTQTILGAVSCVNTDKGVACFQFLANDCMGLAALSATAVKFLGAVAAPIIPNGIGTACRK